VGAGFGLADLRSRRPAAARTIYLWFSMPKIVTATAVMQLVDRRQLDLDGAAAEYLPSTRRCSAPPVSHPS
jgi:CubicO group peptidase (beta-lactamase class C family)